MMFATNYDSPTAETLAAVIARSQIVVTHVAAPCELLPPDFDETDVAILDWIAAEGRRIGRNFVRM